MPVIEVEHLHKRYGDRVAVDDVSFAVERGEVFGLVGPNGAGKTTTVEMIEGLRTPDRGAVSVLGLDPRRHAAELKERLGAQLQESALPEDITAAEAMRLYASFYRSPADWRALLDDVGLTDSAATRYGKLSGGQKQRLSIALALVGDPTVVVFDELTTGLDPQARRDTWDIVERVRDSGVTVLLVSHSMEEAERLSDRLAVVDAGRVVAVDTPQGLVDSLGAPQQIRLRPAAGTDGVDGLLTGLPGVEQVEVSGRHVLVSGSGEFLLSVVSTLARYDVAVADLRVEEATLDDAYLALTGRPLLDIPTGGTR